MGKKIEPFEKEKVLQELKDLYSQNMNYIEKCKKDNCDKKNKQLKELKQVISQLEEYIADLECDCPNCDLRKEDWCEIIADTLLDDDNFPYEEDGFSWR